MAEKRSLTPSQRALRGRIGAYALHARHDPALTTAKARAEFLRRFEERVDPGGILDPVERTRRAAAARQEYFARLAYQSARARAARAHRRAAPLADSTPESSREADDAR